MPNYNITLTWPVLDYDPDIQWLGVFEVINDDDEPIFAELDPSSTSYELTTTIPGIHYYVIKKFRISSDVWEDYYNITKIVGTVNDTYLHVAGIDFLNGLFVRLYVDLFNSTGLYISTSTDGTTWVDRTLVAFYDNSYTIQAASFTYDGSYYYLAIKFSVLNQSILEYTDIWRSSDGSTWTKVSTINRDGPIAQSGPSNISYYNGMLVYSSYHFETKLSGQPSVLMVSFVYSKNHGLTWNVVQTPFYDLSPAGGTKPI